MSVYDKDYYIDDDVFNEENLKKILVSYLISEEIIYNVHWFNGFYDFGQEKFTINQIVNFFSDNNGILYRDHELNKFNLYEIIEIFWNIKEQINNLIEDYKYNYEKNNSCNIDGIILEINKKNICEIELFLKHKNITWTEKENKWILDYTKNEIIKNSKKSIRDSYNDFLKIRSNLDDDSLRKKEQILSHLKSELDFFFNEKNNIKKTIFISLDSQMLKQYWLSLVVHKGRLETNNQIWEKIKNDFNDSNIKEKHSLLNDIFDAIIFLQYKINTK